MKKLILVAIAAAITTIAGAQVQFGIKAGLNLANVNVSHKESIESFSNKTSFNAGVLVSLPLFGNFKLQPEVMYSDQGTKYGDDGDLYKYNLGYVNVPVLFKYKDPSGVFAEIGPQVGFLISAKAKQINNSGGTEDIKDYFKSTDFSGVLGAGYLSPFNLGIDVRYCLGLVNITKNSGQGDGTAKNGVFQVGLFYMFGKKK